MSFERSGAAGEEGTAVAGASRRVAGRALRAGQATMLALALLSLSGVATPAQGANPLRESCAQLRGKRLKSKGRIKVIQQGNEAKAIAYVCLLPRGRVWKAGTAFSSPPGTGYTVDVEAVAGNWIALSFNNTLGIAGTAVDKLVNAATGKSFTYFKALYGPGEPSEEVPRVQRTLLSAGGQLALYVLVERGGTPLRAEVVGFTPNGARRVLDAAPPAQIPAASLTLSGATVGWTDAGEARTATL